MKIKYHIRIFSLITFISLIVGCSRDLEINKVEQAKSGSLTTRAMIEADYYWYNGEKIPLTKQHNKKFVMYKVSDEQSFMTNLQNRNISSNATQSHDYIKPNITSITDLHKTSKIASENYKWIIVEDTKAIAS